MNESIFRKKSLDKIQSPESLNEYVHVANPGMWILLLAVIALLTGALIWGFFGKIQTTVSDEKATVVDGVVFGTISREEAKKIEIGNVILVADKKGKLTNLAAGNEQKDSFYYSGVVDVPNGYYSIEIVTEDIRPISFLLN